MRVDGTEVKTTGNPSGVGSSTRGGLEQTVDGTSKSVLACPGLRRLGFQLKAVYLGSALPRPCVRANHAGASMLRYGAHDVDRRAMLDSRK